MKQQNIFAYIPNTNILFLDKKREEGKRKAGREGVRREKEEREGGKEKGRESKTFPL